MRVNNLENGIESLMTVKISKSSAKQRAGRAGRLLAGKCYRLYPESEYRKLIPTQIPEIQRINLASTLLQLKAMGINNILKFEYISRPPSQLVIQALHLLYALGAIDQNGLLTNPTGTTMSILPLPPMHAKVLMASPDFECSKEIVEILAMMQIQNIFNPYDNRHGAEVTKRKFAAEEGDHISMLNVYTCFIENGKSSQWCRQNFLNYKGLMSADAIVDQLKRLMKKNGIPIKSCRGLIGDTARIRRCLLTGFFSQVAEYKGTETGVYLTLRDGAPFKVYKGSTILFNKEFPKYVVFTDVLSNSIRDVSTIDLDWVKELNQNYYDFGVCLLDILINMKNLGVEWSD
jgi:ATP-dependent RNA helicase DDX35